MYRKGTLHHARAVKEVHTRIDELSSFMVHPEEVRVTPNNLTAHRLDTDESWVDRSQYPGRTPRKYVSNIVRYVLTGHITRVPEFSAVFAGAPEVIPALRRSVFTSEPLYLLRNVLNAHGYHNPADRPACIDYARTIQLEGVEEYFEDQDSLGGTAEPPDQIV